MKTILEDTRETFGKVVKDIKYDGLKHLAIHFDDETCLVVHACLDYDKTPEFNYPIKKQDLCPYEKKELNIITDSEYQTLHKQKAKKTETHQRQWRLEEYERLKKEFGG